MLSRFANLSRFCRGAGKILTTEMIPAQRQLASSSNTGQGSAAGSVDDSKEDTKKDTKKGFMLCEKFFGPDNEDVIYEELTQEDIKKMKDRKFVTKDELTECEIVGNFYIPDGDKFICAYSGVYITHENRTRC